MRLTLNSRSALLISQLHVAPVGLPEPADRRLGRARVLGRGVLPTHLDDRLLVFSGGDAAFHKSPDRAVLHGDQAGGPDQVGLPDPQAPHFRRVVGETDIGPVQVSEVDAFGYDLAYDDAVLDLA